MDSDLDEFFLTANIISLNWFSKARARLIRSFHCKNLKPFALYPLDNGCYIRLAPRRIIIASLEFFLNHDPEVDREVTLVDSSEIVLPFTSTKLKELFPQLRLDDRIVIVLP
jgi:hypothetical protein